MGMVVGVVGLAALAVSALVATIALILYISASLTLERGSWLVWIGLVGLSGTMTVLIAFYTYSHTISQIPPSQGGPKPEFFRAVFVLAGMLGLTPGISSLFGLLALAIPREKELNKPASPKANKEL